MRDALRPKYSESLVKKLERPVRLYYNALIHNARDYDDYGYLSEGLEAEICRIAGKDAATYNLEEKFEEYKSFKYTRPVIMPYILSMSEPVLAEDITVDDLYEMSSLIITAYDGFHRELEKEGTDCGSLGYYAVIVGYYSGLLEMNYPAYLKKHPRIDDAYDKARLEEIGAFISGEEKAKTPERRISDCGVIEDAVLYNDVLAVLNDQGMITLYKGCGGIHPEKTGEIKTNAVNGRLVRRSDGGVLLPGGGLMYLVDIEHGSAEKIADIPADLILEYVKGAAGQSLLAIGKENDTCSVYEIDTANGNASVIMKLSESQKSPRGIVRIDDDRFIVWNEDDAVMYSRKTKGPIASYQDAKKQYFAEYERTHGESYFDPRLDDGKEPVVNGVLNPVESVVIILFGTPEWKMKIWSWDVCGENSVKKECPFKFKELGEWGEWPAYYDSDGEISAILTKGATSLAEDEAKHGNEFGNLYVVSGKSNTCRFVSRVNLSGDLKRISLSGKTVAAIFADHVDFYDVKG